MKTTEQLTHLKRQAEAIIHAVETKFNSLPDDKLNAKPAADRWSILECFEHLNLYSQYYLTALEVAVGKTAGAQPQDLKYTWIGKKSIAMMHPSNAKKQKTFKKMIPAKSRLTRDVLATFLNDQQRILRLIAKASSLDVTKSLVPVEFFKLLKMNIAETLEFVIVHEQRHLQQAEGVLARTPSTTSRPALSI
jgi:uncharacterized damage-inducible protein DinB